MKSVGIDLAGKPENDTGFCVLRNSKIETKILHSDRSIIDEVKYVSPNVVAIDAPFGTPEDGMYRDSELELKDRGFNPLSPNFKGMKVLVQRAKGLISELKDIDQSFEIIEVFPEASKSILHLKPSEKANEDEFDALACAVTGRKYLGEEYENLEGIIVPGK